MKKKLAIIGASHFQEPLIQKAKQMGVETHVFAWQCGDVGEYSADYFYPVSIVEVDQIAEICKQVGVDGVATIASDLANIAVAGVADKLGLVANSVECVRKSTNKSVMRQVFEQCGCPSPKSVKVYQGEAVDGAQFDYPVIVKPVDRSGSRGITKLTSSEGLSEAIERACAAGFEKAALVEEFATGIEYSVEYVSWKGNHRFLSITEKFTSGAPGFVETGHLEPARLSDEMAEKVKAVVEHALNCLGVEYGPSHSEIKIAADGAIKIIEIGSRMGGDYIGSHLIELSTGYDFVGATVDVALGVEPKAPFNQQGTSAAVRFVFSQQDVDVLNAIKQTSPELLVHESAIEPFDHEIVDSSSRYGSYIFCGPASQVHSFLPSHTNEG